MRILPLSVVSTAAVCASFAEVVINEISAASSDRLLRYSASGQPGLGGGNPWHDPAFDASAWSAGGSPLGFGAGGFATNLSQELQGKAPSLYLRKNFQATAGQASSTGDLIFDVDFADGLVVYVNGVEVERCNLGPSGLFVYSDQFAFRTNPVAQQAASLVLGRCNDLLVEGENVIAVQVAAHTLNGPLRFNGSLRIDAGETLFPVVLNDFSDANGAFRTHTNVFGVVSDSTTGSPVVDGWLANSPLVESGAGWEELEIVTRSDTGAGEGGGGAISYTATASGVQDGAVIPFPEVDLGDHWQTGAITTGDLAGTRVSFRFKGDVDTAYDFVVRSPDGSATVSGFPMVVSGSENAVGYWRFDDDNAQAGTVMTNSADFSGNNLDATPSGSGGGTYSTDVPGPVIFDPLANATRSNTFSMDVSASNRRMRVTNSPAFDSSFTAEMFIKIDGEPTGYNSFMRRQISGGSRWQIDFDHANAGAFGRIRSRLDTGDGLNTNFVLGPVGGGSIPASERIWVDTDAGNGLISSYNDPSDWAQDGNGINDTPGWHHVALTLDESNGVVRFYYDYQLMQTRTLSGVSQNGYVHPSAAMEFGKFSSTYAMLIDEVRYTGRVLGPSEFLQVVPAPTELWTTYEVDLGAGDPAERAAFLAQLNAGNLTSFVPALRLREESVSPEGRTLLLDRFEVEFAEGLGGSLLIPSNSTWSYHPGTAEPSGGIYEPAALDEERAEFVDWIELWNNDSVEADLTGWSLTDDSGDPGKWTFPPGTNISAGGYLLVLADELDTGGLNTNYLHANFKLAREGEYLGLFDAGRNFRSGFADGFPPQSYFHSFGLRQGGAGYVHFEQPSPGRPNGGAFVDGIVEDPVFGVPGGFHTDTVVLSISSATQGAVIRYTTDGSEPTLDHGATYTAPMVLSRIDSRTGHVIRARAFVSGMLPSGIESATYLVGQSTNLISSPALIFSGNEERSFTRPFGVLSIEGGNYVDGIWEARENDDYNIPFWRGRVFERPAFVEFYQANSTNGFGVNGGLRVAASNFSRPRFILNGVENSPWPNNPRDKASFNVYFRNEYEDSRIQFPVFGEDYPGNSFEQLRPRAGKNDINNPYIKDEVIRRLYIEMGQVGSRGIFNSLYLNGEWKGFYNTCERLREPFFQSHYPDSEQWDIRQAGNPNGFLAEGDNQAWIELNSRLQASNVNSESNWNLALELVDPVAMADYFLLNIYGATWDWPYNNWVSARERSTNGRYRFYVWDAEGAFGHPRNSNNSNSQKPVNFNIITEDLLTRTDDTSRIFQRLQRWPEFRMILADRIHRHFFNGGTLDDSTPADSKVKEIIDEASAEVGPLIQERLGQSIDLEFWRYWTAPGASRRSYLLGPNDEHFRDAGYWPETEPPSFSAHGGEFPADFQLTINAGSGTVYFSLDGSDPRLFGGAVSPDALTYDDPITLPSGVVTVKARLHSPGGEWSALTEADFRIGLSRPEATNLVISEIHYHPAPPSPTEVNAGFTDQDDFEFIQLQNIGTDTLDLADLAFTDGIAFEFAGSPVFWVAPGASVMVVKDIEAFRFRYGTTYDGLIAGQYEGSLSNGGEQLTLQTSAAVIRSFAYDDQAPWPALPDGAGVSLVLNSPGSNPDHSLPESWTRSSSVGGYPGGQPVSLTYAQWASYLFVPGDAVALWDDPDQDGLPNLVEFYLGSLPHLDDAAMHAPATGFVEEGGEIYQTYEFSLIAGQNGLEGTVEVSGDLQEWGGSGVEEILPVAAEGRGWLRRRFRVSQPVGDRTQSFLRLRVLGIGAN